MGVPGSNPGGETMLEEITKKVLSYCEIPQEITDESWISQYQNGCYVIYSLEKDNSNYGELEKWIASNYPELIGTEFLIDLDY